jgi:hypothetical protein
MTSDDPRGLHNKFYIERTDGRHRPGEKHYGCRYFVLDLNHDAAVPLVLPTLADAYETTGRPTLATDLRTLATDVLDALNRAPDLRPIAQAERAVIDAALVWGDTTEFCQCENRPEGTRLLDAITELGEARRLVADTEGE